MKFKNIILLESLILIFGFIAFAAGCGGTVDTTTTTAPGTTTTTGSGTTTTTDGSGTTTTTDGGGTTTSTGTTTTTLALSWTQATAAAAFPARMFHSSVVFNDGSGEKIYVIGGQIFDGTTAVTNDVWSSSDGITWTVVTPAAGFAARQYHSSVVYNNKIWVIGGQTSGGNVNDVWYSPDGANWTQATAAAAFPVRNGHTSLVFDNGGGSRMWVIGGAGAADYNDVWSSADGVTWTQATAASGWTGRKWHSSVVYGNKMWVIASGIIEGDRKSVV
jgi:hypothetical protein